MRTFSRRDRANRAISESLRHPTARLLSYRACYVLSILLLLLRPRLGGLNLHRLGIFTLNVLAASLVTALSALFIYRLGTVLLPPAGTGARETLYLAVELGAGIGVAGVVYFGFSRFLGIDDAVPLDRLVRRALRLRRK